MGSTFLPRMKSSLPSPLLTMLARRAWVILGVLVALAVALRVLLAAYCPVPFGYVFDLYYRGITHLFKTGQIPGPKDCWECTNPPVFFLMGWPFYALGMKIRPGDEAFALRMAGLLPLGCGAVISIYAYRLLGAFRFDRAHRVVGAALILTFPCLFISSYGLEADIVVTAWMTVFLYYLVRYHISRDPPPMTILVVGSLAGVAMLTKYSGFVTLLTALAVVAIRVTRCRVRRVLRDGALLVGACLAVCGWKFVTNIEEHGTPFVANWPATNSYSIGSKTHRYWNIYDFATFRLGDALDLWPPNAPPGILTHQDVYYSVPTCLHAQAWTDMSFFSVPGRHGLPRAQPYPLKEVPLWLIASVLILGVVPSALALIGFAATLRRRFFWPLGIYTLIGIASYTWWFVAQMTWSIKTKYILFLLPAYVCYVLLGLKVLRSCRTFLADVALVLLFALFAVTHVYLFEFAVR